MSVSPRPARLGVYVHYPYCAKRCPYCDFNVVQPGPEGRPDARYRDAVLAELDVRAAAYSGRPPAVSLYFGGGTPALWDPECIGAVVEGVHARIGLVEDAEITLEANPGEAQADTFIALRSIGINRLSLGTQSFDAEILARLGRRNSPDDNRRCVSEARRAGFDNLSLDLIQAVAGQTTQAALEDVDAVLELEPTHVSTYELTIHPQTPFGARASRGELLTADEDAQAEIYEATRLRLSESGVMPYEVSNAARPGKEAVHNGLYWRMDECLALGAGAHGFVRDAALEWGERWENERHASRYMDAALKSMPAERHRERLDAATLDFETLMTGLRLDAGIELSPRARGRFVERLETLQRRALVILNAEKTSVRLTPRGRLLLDEVSRALLD